jgi:hypothetical protein
LQERFKPVVVGDAKFFASLTRRHREKVKTLRKQCAVVILTLTMAISAYAGILQTPGYAGGSTGDNTTSLTDVVTTVIVTVVTTVP